MEGEVTVINHRELKKRGAWIISFDMTDHTGSARIHCFMEAAQAKPILEGVQGPNAKKKKPGSWLRVHGKVTVNRYDGELVIEPFGIMKGKRPERQDTAPVKRVELHLHTNMSSMDALTDTTLAVRQAAAWGMPAIGITDHGVAQAYPDAMHTVEGGCTVAGTDRADEDPLRRPGILCQRRRATASSSTACGDLSAAGDFVAFDLETTGPPPSRTERITEIGAVIFRDGQPCERFQTFGEPPPPPEPEDRRPHRHHRRTCCATAPEIEQVLPEFFCSSAAICPCAPNADFDVGFIQVPASGRGSATRRRISTP